MFSHAKHFIPALLVLLAISSARAAEPLKSGIDRATFDASIKPGDDFFMYVNGKWIKANPIPPQYSHWDLDAEIRQGNEAALHEIMDGLVKQTKPLDDNSRKLRDYWIAAMDEAGLEKQGVTPLAADLHKIAAMQRGEDLPSLLADFRSRGIEFLFSLYVDQDEKKSDRYVVHLSQGGLGLPERDYYLEDTEEYRHIRAEYRKHVEKMLALLGDSPADAAAGAEAVIRIETSLAKASRTPTDLRDPQKNYNAKTIAELDALAPGMHWKDYLQTIGAGTAKDVVVGQPEFFTRVDAMLKEVPAADWRAYLRWGLIDGFADNLTAAIERENFHFRDEVMRGVKEMKPRWKRELYAVDEQMGEALGKLYVEKRFPPSAKTRMDTMVAHLKDAFRERIKTRDWMSDETKKAALYKLDRLGSKIGYPAKWRDYSKLNFTPDSFCKNAMAAANFDFHYRMDRLDKPVDRGEWGMTPPTINAYYDGTKNEIVFPAGILQPPYFDATVDDAFNYGAIGAVIGHEMTHGFDDQGSQADADGNLKDWWTAADRAKFEAKTARLVKQFNDCVAVDNLHVNGELTLGENLADLGGVMIAFDAYTKSLNGKPAPVIDGLTGPQRFFIGYAISWRGHSRDAAERMQLRTDPHSPVRFRVLLPLSNCPAFYDAFDIKPGDKMYRKPEDRVEVW
ncbi:MAG TPA: M13 family metallopeptidase [Tepidisphaeraceae bacterium]|jgi:putative endopeptidase|nr:M13 family metallopeptidase [Tepidisphaeraceae bacterium]